MEDLDVNAERENIQSANLNALPPMRRRFRVEKIAVQTLQTHMVRAKPLTPVLLDHFGLASTGG